ncbi:hypothetical protein ACHHV8_25515 [Paenibacillus sp. TAB 01]|uniref:hypothetical protein n=1 Tax=Paenibacillus sp. TAB 01 TaxID=3368988 RepID=UPI003750DC2C
MKGMTKVPPISKEKNRLQLEGTYKSYKERLTPEKFNEFINELSEVIWKSNLQLDSFPWQGGLDGFVAEKKQISEERLIKVLLLKQKYTGNPDAYEEDNKNFTILIERYKERFRRSFAESGTAADLQRLEQSIKEIEVLFQQIFK